MRTTKRVILLTESVWGLKDATSHLSLLIFVLIFPIAWSRIIALGPEASESIVGGGGDSFIVLFSIYILLLLRNVCT